MTTLTRHEIIGVVGEIDDRAIADIMATAATAQELAEARAWLDSDEAMMNQGKPLAAGRVGQLVEILENIDEDERPQPAGRRI